MRSEVFPWAQLLASPSLPRQHRGEIGLGGQILDENSLIGEKHSERAGKQHGEKLTKIPFPS